MLKHCKFYVLLKFCNISTYQSSKISYKYASLLILKRHKTTEKELKMASGGNIYELWSWMYAHNDSARMVTYEFLNGVEIFVYQAGNTPLTLDILIRKAISTVPQMLKRRNTWIWCNLIMQETFAIFYLGLSTDGFSHFEMPGRQYSL